MDTRKAARNGSVAFLPVSISAWPEGGQQGAGGLLCVPSPTVAVNSLQVEVPVRLYSTGQGIGDLLDALGISMRIRG
jgi:hypothetical protein